MLTLGSMTPSLRNQLVALAHEHQTKTDPSHDVNHVLRVMNIAEKIAESVGADLDVVLAAACFHDVVVYLKNSPQSANETNESAELAGELLKKVDGYPIEKIENVQMAIHECSFRKGVMPDLLESKVLQDADRLEATGAISIMRTFSSGGQMNRPFYRVEDPFCEIGIPESGGGGMDLFYRRLLIVESRMHTDMAKQIAKRRTEFLRGFIDELKIELKESGIIGE